MNGAIKDALWTVGAALVALIIWELVLSKLITPDAYDAAAMNS